MRHVQNNIHVVFFAVVKNNIFALLLCLRKYCLLVRTATCLHSRSQGGVNRCVPSLSHDLKSNNLHARKKRFRITLASRCVFWTSQSQNDTTWQVFHLLLTQLQCYFHLLNGGAKSFGEFPLNIYTDLVAQKPRSGVLTTEPTRGLQLKQLASFSVAIHDLKFKKKLGEIPVLIFCRHIWH